MKTLKEVVAEINTILNTDWMKEYGERKAEKERKKGAKRLKFLKLMRTFLEDDPSPFLLRQQLDKVENNIQIIMGRFSFEQYANMSVGELSKKRKDYEKREDVPKMREHVKVLKFLLKK